MKPAALTSACSLEGEGRGRGNRWAEAGGLPLLIILRSFSSIKYQMANTATICWVVGAQIFIPPSFSMFNLSQTTEWVGQSWTLCVAGTVTPPLASTF